MSKWGSIAFSVFVIACAAVLIFGLHTCGQAEPDCWGGVYDADERHTCEGARVTLEERGGKRYAVCSCDPLAVTIDAGPDAAVER